MKRFLTYLLLICTFCLLMGCESKPTTNITDKSEGLATFEIKEGITSARKLSKSIDSSLQKINSNLSELEVSVLNDFSKAFTSFLFDGKTNQIFSPVSLYFCLAMLYVGTSDELIKSAMENLMHIENEESLLSMLKQIEANNYYFNELGRTYLANSIWISKYYHVLDTYVAKLQNEFNAQSFEIDFYDFDGREQIINWINHYTENLLNLDQEKFPIAADTAILLANTLYFNNKWTSSSDIETEKPFYKNDKEQVTVKYFKHEITTLMKETKEYFVFQDYFENDNKITFIMAKDNNLDKIVLKDYQEFFQDLNLAKIGLFLPPFENYSEFDLEGAFYENGCERIFQHVNGYQLIGEELYVSLIKQEAGIKLTKEGVEAAAVTVIGIKANSVSDIKDYYLDHPFMYIISDSNDVPLFIGTMVDPSI